MVAEPDHILAVSLHPDGLFHAVGDKLEIVLRERRLFRCRLRELAFYEDIDRVSGTDLHVAELHAAHTVDVDAEFSLRPREADGGDHNTFGGPVGHHKPGGGCLQIRKHRIEVDRVARESEHIGWRRRYGVVYTSRRD